MSIIKHRHINHGTSRKVSKQKIKAIKPLNKTVKFNNKNLDDIIFKRYIFISIIIVLCFIGIGIRLFKLQVIEHEKYSDMLAVATEKTVEGTSAPRGRIYDRNYKLLVDNKAIKTIYYKKEPKITAKEEVKLAYKLAKMLNIDYSKLSEKMLKTFWYINNEEKAKQNIKRQLVDQIPKMISQLTTNVVGVYNNRCEEITALIKDSIESKISGMEEVLTNTLQEKKQQEQKQEVRRRFLEDCQNKVIKIKDSLSLQ